MWAAGQGERDRSGQCRLAAESQKVSVSGAEVAKVSLLLRSEIGSRELLLWTGVSLCLAFSGLVFFALVRACAFWGGAVEAGLSQVPRSRPHLTAQRFVVLSFRLLWSAQPPPTPARLHACTPARPPALLRCTCILLLHPHVAQRACTPLEDPGCTLQRTTLWASTAPSLCLFVSVLVFLFPPPLFRTPYFLRQWLPPAPCQHC